MSSKTSPHVPMMAKPPDGGGGSGFQPVQGRPKSSTLESDDETADEFEAGDGVHFSPPPLPNDSKVLAELRGRLEKANTEAKAGIGEDWELVHARIFGPESDR
jgi:hypothetical protein